MTELTAFEERKIDIENDLSKEIDTVIVDDEPTRAIPALIWSLVYQCCNCDDPQAVVIGAVGDIISKFEFLQEEEGEKMTEYQPGPKMKA
jgi:hypothetical protein